MEENLVGYILKALDPDTERAVQHYLRDSPEARERLERIQRALEPLAADQEPAAPPPGLWVRTLASVAEYQCRNLPFAPLPAGSQTGGTAGRSRWRPADLGVAAAIVLLSIGLGLGAVSRVRHEQQIAACQRNLAAFHGALQRYSEVRDRQFPRVPPGEPVGKVVPILYDAGVLLMDAKLGCPGRADDFLGPVSERMMEELRQRDPEEYRRLVHGLMGWYAYSLGSRDEGFQFLPGQNDGLPIMADSPPVHGGDEIAPGNSRNHARAGQNVLFMGGHVKFLTGRAVASDEDIYLNRRGRVQRGLDRQDVVLGASWACP